MIHIRGGVQNQALKLKYIFLSVWRGRVAGSERQECPFFHADTLFSVI